MKTFPPFPPSHLCAYRSRRLTPELFEENQKLAPIRIGQGWQMKNILFLSAVLAAILSGCTSYESARTAHLAREYLTEDLEEQIVFNLIRAKNGLPFAHYDIGNTQTTVSVNAMPSVGISRSALSAMARSITRGLTSNSTSTRSNAVVINVAPIFTDPKVYLSYVTFLNSNDKGLGLVDCLNSEESTEGSAKEGALATKNVNGSAMALDAANATTEAADLEAASKTVTETVTTDKDNKTTTKVVETKTPEKSIIVPPINIGHIYSIVAQLEKPNSGYVEGTVRKWGKCWYYVPNGYRQEFSILCMALVARAKATEDATAKAVEKNTEQLQQLQLQTR